MSKSTYRPPSVWITQVIFLPLLVIGAIALPISVFQCFLSESVQHCLSFSSIEVFSNGLVILAVGFLVFWGLQKRKQYGKWLAAILLIGGMVVAIAESHYLQLIYRSLTQWQALPAPPYECWKADPMFTNANQSCGYSNYPELALRLISDLIPALISGFLAVRLLCSRASKQFFQ